MTRIYVCRKGKKKYSPEAYSQSRFCLNCGTYLTSRIVVSSRSHRRIEAPETGVESIASENQWLPRGYEERKGQVKFIEEATKALESNKVFLGSSFKSKTFLFQDLIELLFNPLTSILEKKSLAFKVLK